MTTRVLAAEETTNFLLPNATFFVEFVLFLIVLFVLYRFVVPPLSRALDERQEMVRKQIADREKAARTLQQAKDRYESELAEARAQAASIRDQARADAAGSERQLVELDAELSDATARRDESIAELDRQSALARAERARAVALVPADLLALYDKIRAQQGGVGAAVLRQRRCEGCRLELNAADLRELAGEPTDAVLRCPECNRLLVRTAESGL